MPEFEGSGFVSSQGADLVKATSTELVHPPEMINPPENHSPTTFSATEVEATLSALTREFTTGKEKQGGWLRGAFLPLAAGIAGSGIASFFKLSPEAVENIGRALTLVDSKVGEVVGATAQVIEQGPPSLLDQLGAGGTAALGALGGSWAASLARRAFSNESLFKYYARYSQLDAKSLQPGFWLAESIVKRLTRQPEHIAFNTLIYNPANPGAPVRELLETVTDPEKLSQLEREHKVTLLAKGLFYELSVNATEYFGAEYSDAERDEITANRLRVQEAMTSLCSTEPDEAKRASMLASAAEMVKRDEKLRYLLAVLIMSMISGVKAFTLGVTFNLVMEMIPLILANASSSLRDLSQQSAEVLQTVSVTAAQTAQKTSQNMSEVLQTMPVQIEQGTSLLGKFKTMMSKVVNIFEVSKSMSDLPQPAIGSPILHTSTAGLPAAVEAVGRTATAAVDQNAPMSGLVAAHTLVENSKKVVTAMSGGIDGVINSTVDAGRSAAASTAEVIQQAPVVETEATSYFSKLMAGIRAAISGLGDRLNQASISEVNIPSPSEAGIQLDGALASALPIDPHPVLDVVGPSVEVATSVPAYAVDVANLSATDILHLGAQNSTIAIEAVLPAIQLLDHQQLGEVAVRLSQEDPTFAAALADFVPVGASSAQIGAALAETATTARIMAPQGMYILRKIFQAISCVASQGLTCPAMAGP